MDSKQVLIDLLVLSSGIFVALMTTYYVLKNEIRNFINLKQIELQKESRAHLLPLRLQAHERLIVFVDRLSPTNLLVRVHQQGIELATLHAGILNEIKTEYQHNIAQQLYVDSVTWNVVKKLKDDTIAMINNAIKGLPENTNGIDLSKVIIQHIATISENPYDLTIELIKKDIHKLF